MLELIRGYIPYVIVAGMSFWAFLGMFPDDTGPRPREEIVLAADDLRSNIAGQPLAEGKRGVIRAPVDHPEGHVMYTVPKKLPEGEYRFEIDADFEVGRRYHDATCLMDLLADAEIVAVEQVPPLSNNAYYHPSVTFKSPTVNGANVFQTRLYCDGRASVLVKSVKLIRNPSTPPAVVIQQ